MPLSDEVCKMKHDQLDKAIGRLEKETENTRRYLEQSAVIVEKIDRLTDTVESLTHVVQAIHKHELELVTLRRDFQFIVERIDRLTGTVEPLLKIHNEMHGMELRILSISKDVDSLKEVPGRVKVIEEYNLATIPERVTALEGKALKVMGGLSVLMVILQYLLNRFA